MKFQVDFNYNNNYTEQTKVLKDLGCEIIYRDEFYYWEKEIDTFEELRDFQEKLEELTKIDYSLVINMDGIPSIYFDDKV